LKEYGLSVLAINGGEPVRKHDFPAQETIGPEEVAAVLEVLETKKLSGYRGNASDAFWGGAKVKELEATFSLMGTLSLAVNSCTSALQIACGAIACEPGCEIIVSPWSMTCSATAPLVYGAKPVFVDIDPETFCLDADKVADAINENTLAIIGVDLFGHPFSEGLTKVAEENNIHLIEDAAQAIGAYRKGRPAGTLGSMGCFSFTQGKHLTAGEGGIITFKYDNGVYYRASLIRNHAEASINDDFQHCEYNFAPNMVGFNMRMTEIQAAILIEQLKKLDSFVEMRRKNAGKLNVKLDSFPFISSCRIMGEIDHSFYVASYHFDSKIAGISRDKYINAVKAELAGEEGRIDRGVPIGNGYIKPIYKMPLFQNKNHWAFQDDWDYSEIELPVVERLQAEELFITLYHGLPLSSEDIDDIYKAFKKVADNIHELK